MKHFPVIYPILFSMNPSLILLAANVNYIGLSELFPQIIILPLIATASLVLLNFWLKNIDRAAFIVFIFYFWFFNFGAIRNFAGNLTISQSTDKIHWLIFAIWTAIFLFICSNPVWRRIRNPKALTSYLTILTVGLLFISSYKIVVHYGALIYTHNKQVKDPVINSINLESSLQPDIYYIILDGYARADVLNKIYEYDNSEFLTSLKDRGFYIAEKSQSDYMQTALSLSSSLNLDYLSDLPKKMTDRGMLRGLIKYNRVKTLLEKLGYKTVFFASNYLPTDVPEANIYLSSPNVSSAHYLDSLLIYNSVAIIPVENHWLDLPMARFNQQHERVQYTLERVSNLSDIPGPKFVFAHITAPHPPFVFDSHGPINSDQVFYLFDGDTSFTSDQNYIDGYIEQMTYINHQVLTMLDGILANSKIPPIIILQGDHGPGAYWDNMSAERTCLKERFSILNAYHLPDNGNNNLYASISPVNTFRVIFNTYFNTDFDILENRNYFSLWNQPYGFIDVTGKTETECKIP